MARAKFASTFSRVISAILALSAKMVARPFGGLVSSDFHAFSLVATKVSNARMACSMLIFISSRSACGISGVMNASLAAMLHSSSRTTPLSRICVSGRGCGAGRDGGSGGACGDCGGDSGRLAAAWAAAFSMANNIV